MKNTENLVEEGKAQWSKLKTEMEHLGVQMALGRSEAKEAFDREWKNFTEFMEEQAHRFRRKSYWADRLLTNLEVRAKALKNELEQSSPENEIAFDTRRDRVLRTIYELELIIDELYPVLEEEEKDLLSDFRIKMEMYRTHYINISAEKLTTLDAPKKRLIDKIDEVLTWRERDTETGREKIRRFNDEIGASFNHMKRAFGELFK